MSSTLLRRLSLTAAISSCLAFACKAPEERSETPSETKTQALQPTTRTTETTPSEAKATGLVEDPRADDSPEIRTAVAVLTPTKGNQVTGTVTFQQTDDGLEVEAEVEGLPPGAHAYHIHLFGDCSSDDGNSAGTHMNFDGPSKHPPDGIKHITGNLGELTAEDDGKAKASSTISKATLRVPHSIIGRSVIIHEKGNDESSPPIGAAGGRLACGVIGVKEG